MQLINSSGVYSFILTEVEWYAATEQQQEAWVNQCKREAEEAKCRFATILVEPDAVMSISPNPRRHKVWGHSAPVNADSLFAEELATLRDQARSSISASRMQYLVKRVFGI